MRKFKSQFGKFLWTFSYFVEITIGYGSFVLAQTEAVVMMMLVMMNGPANDDDDDNDDNGGDGGDGVTGGDYYSSPS